MRMPNGEIHQEWKCPKCGFVQVEMFFDYEEYEGRSIVLCEDCNREFQIDDLPEFK